MERHARYLAIRVVCILDKFQDHCVDVVRDDGTDFQGKRNAEVYLEAQVALPESPLFPADVDWKSIKPDLMYRILSLHSQVEGARRSIASTAEFTSPPDFEEFFKERRYQYSKLGLTAAELAWELRKTYTIADRDCGDWNPVEHLKHHKSRIEKERKVRGDRV
jgi:hypothetical protein